MRLMGLLSFGKKAILIAVMFLLPLLWVSFDLFSARKAAIEFSEKEILGVEYAKTIYPLLHAAQQFRRDSTAAASGAAPASMGEVQGKLQSAQAKVADAEKKLGSTLQTSKEFAAVGTAMAKTQSGSKDVVEVFKDHTAHVNAIISLLSAVTDRSNLSLDPDLDSYYVMDAALFRLPDITEYSSKLRGLGNAILKSGTITPAQQSQLSEWMPIIDFQFVNMRDGLGKAIAANPTVAKAVDASQTLTDTEAFNVFARKNLISAQDFSPESQASYLAAANKAVSGQHALALQLLDELQGLIETRVGTVKRELLVSSLILLVCLSLATYFFYSFYRISGAGMNEILRHLREMSEGDLRNRPAKPWAKDEPALVMLDLNVTYKALHELIRKVRHSARALHGAAGEVSAASMDLSARTESAAASLQQQAASMEEIGATVGDTAQRAQSAAKFAVDNSQVAEKAGKVFAEVVTTMHEIHTSSSKIGDIIGVIDGIAFQTNILALNAAVEAARAGEAGRGFAVVATEVRTLAQRSAEAAREIKSLISASVERVEGGTRVVEAAGATMNEVVTNARQINTFLSEISNSALEQAAGVKEVGLAIQDLDSNTQQNAALVEETSAAAAALSSQADILQHEIANFRVV